MSAWVKISDEPPPNNVFDVIAKYWDASLDKFLVRRVTDCVIVQEAICCDTPGGPRRLVDMGLLSTHWMPVPDPPEGTNA